MTAVQRDDAGAIVERFRAAPSGGARYPLETYLAINRVTGLAPGIYRYLPNDHQLVLVREGLIEPTYIPLSPLRESNGMWTGVTY